jgi:hypothetical protein
VFDLDSGIGEEFEDGFQVEMDEESVGCFLGFGCEESILFMTD